MNPQDEPAKLIKAVYCRATGDGSIQERLHEAMLMIDGFDIGTLGCEDRGAWKSFRRLGPSLNMSLRVRKPKAKLATEIIFGLLEHICMHVRG